MTVTDHSSHEGPHLERKLSKLNMLAMTFAILNTWIALSGSLGLVLPSGGSVAFIYGFIFCVLCSLCLASSLGELASIWPTAGGQYHFAFFLAPEKYKRPVSFLTGWLAIAGWLTLVTVGGMFGVFFIDAAAVLASNGTFVNEAWKTYLIFLALMVFSTVANVFGNRILGKWNDGAMIWSVLLVITLSITLLATAPKARAEFVFTDFENTTGWSDGMSWILGLLQSALSLIGFDAATHMTEEMPDPRRDTPKAMIYAVIVGGITGFIFLVIMLFCLTNIDYVLSSSTGMPIIELVYQSTGSRAAGTIFAFALAVCFVNGATAGMTTASRLLWSMARDGGMPGYRTIAKIEPRTSVPVAAVLVVFVFNALFGLLYLGPTVAFSAYSASTTIFLNLSYAMPILLLLIRGRVKMLGSEVCNFSLGKAGYVINVVAVLYAVVTSVFFCFPTSLPASTSTMNYVCVVLGIFIILVLALWFWCRGSYEGPQTELIISAVEVSAEEGRDIVFPGIKGEKVVMAARGKNASSSGSGLEEIV